MADPGTIAGGGAVLAVVVREIWNFFKGDLKKVGEEVSKLPSVVDKLVEEAKDAQSLTKETYELVRNHVTRMAATGERQIELLQELIGIVKDLQKDVTEMKIRNMLLSRGE